jgi:hypothetical protein
MHITTDDYLGYDFVMTPSKIIRVVPFTIILCVLCHFIEETNPFGSSKISQKNPNSVGVRVIHKVTTLCLHPVFGPAFSPYSLFRRYLQSKEILLNLSMKCWNSAFNAQGLGVIIVVVQVGAVSQMYVAVVEALRKKHETQFTTKNWWKS